LIDKESKVKAILMAHLRTPGVLPPSFIPKRHEDRVSAGGADISVTGNMTTSWLEIKLADPYIRSRGVQELEMLRYGRASHAYYVIYYDKKGEQTTHIVHPTEMQAWPETSKRWAPNFNHRFISDFILEIHQVNRKISMPSHTWDDPHERLS
jgi:hypothetical protein